jgi:hypothetical protein
MRRYFYKLIQANDDIDGAEENGLKYYSIPHINIIYPDFQIVNDIIKLSILPS